MFKVPNWIENHSKNIMFVGLGGGFDIFGAIPLWMHLNKWVDKNFVFVNYNIAAKKFMDLRVEDGIYPESLFKWIEQPVYTLPPSGVKNQVKFFEAIIEEHQVDTIIGIDGGVDSLMHGDEKNCGTILEDFTTLAAIDEFKIPSKCVVCCGFGTESEEGLCHYLILENMAQLVSQNAFLGCCSLTSDMEEFKIYKRICEATWNNGRKSHIHTKVISAILGKFGKQNFYEGIESNTVGDKAKEEFITPLMSIFWFFDFDAVVKNNKLIPELKAGATRTDSLLIYRQFLDNCESKRDWKDIPL